jgi:hypothetical protein
VREVSVNLGRIVVNSDGFHGQIVIIVFRESFNNLGFNFMQLIDESKMTLAGYSTTLDEVFVGPRTDTESVDGAILIVSPDQVNYLLSIKDSAICQKIKTAREIFTLLFRNYVL